MTIQKPWTRFSMRESPLLVAVPMIVAIAMTPQSAKAGPCSGDIAGLETALRLFGQNAPKAQPQPSIDTEPTRALTPDLPTRLKFQFSATIARAKRLDTDGDRLGCFGALNAARRIYVLVDRQ